MAQSRRGVALVLGVAALLAIFTLRASVALARPQQPDGTLSAATTVVYSQPMSTTGMLYGSSWWDPNGSDYDQYVWDGFTLPSTLSITEIRWYGGYNPAYSGSGGPVADFTVSIYNSIPGGMQPDIIASPPVEYQAGGNAHETLVGTFGGKQIYAYSSTLPTPFQAAGGTKYWVQIEAWQHGVPDWGWAAGLGGDSKHFLRMAGAGDTYYLIVNGDAAFALAANPTLPFRLRFPIIFR